MYEMCGGMSGEGVETVRLGYVKCLKNGKLKNENGEKIMSKLWKKFDELSGKCYSNMIGAGGSFEVWNETFAALTDLISTGREKDPNFAAELIDLDDETDFSHDVDGWLEDYLDELEMRGMQDQVLEVCRKILALFCWERESPSDFNFRISSALAEKGENQEALKFCEEWFEKEADNILAAVALIYAKIGVKDLEGAEELVKRYISEETRCTEENDIVFTAASTLYKVKGDKKAEKRINKAMKEYEKELEEYVTSWEEEDWDLDMENDFLPFN